MGHRAIDIPGRRLPARIRDAADRADAAADYLDRSREVDAFASLIAARSVEAPLSIGIFGEWGSGKSWFMRQLRQQVAEIAADTRDSGARQRDVTFYKHIAQVEFNAWHDAEGDVLASLLDHIFTRLDLGEGVGVVKEEQARREGAGRGRAQGGRSGGSGGAVGGRARRSRGQHPGEGEGPGGDAGGARGRGRRQGGRGGRPAGCCKRSGRDRSGSVPSAVTELRSELSAARHELGRANGLFAPLVHGEAVRPGPPAVGGLRPPGARTGRRPVAGAVAAALSTETKAMLWGLAALLVGGLTGAAAFVRRQTAWLRERLDALAAAEGSIDEASPSNSSRSTRRSRGCGSRSRRIVRLLPRLSKPATTASPS